MNVKQRLREQAAGKENNLAMYRGGRKIAGLGNAIILIESRDSARQIECATNRFATASLLKWASRVLCLHGQLLQFPENGEKAYPRRRI